MPASFSISPTDLLLWLVLGLIGGLVGGLAVRGGSLHWTDALLGLPGALIGGVAIEFFGLRESGESVSAPAAAFFGSLLLAALVRLLPGRFSV